MKWNSKNLWQALWVAGITAVFFLPVLRAEFLHWDDPVLYVDNFYYRGLSPAHWRWMCTTFLMGHWQPLTWLSCALDYMTWGLNSHGWHATNLLLHMINAVLVWMLCLVFLQKRPEGYAAAGLAALFYSIHPLRTEVVAWAATRGYLLCTTFCLLTVLFYLRDAGRKRYPLTAYLFFLLATCTKGVGMMLPLVLLLLDWFPLRRWGAGAGGQRSGVRGQGTEIRGRRTTGDSRLRQRLRRATGGQTTNNE